MLQPYLQRSLRHEESSIGETQLVWPLVAVGVYQVYRCLGLRQHPPGDGNDSGGTKQYTGYLHGQWVGCQEPELVCSGQGLCNLLKKVMLHHTRCSTGPVKGV